MRHGERLQVEGTPEALREVAHDLRAYERAGQERGAAGGLRGAAEGGHHPGEGGGGLSEQHVGRDPPERGGRAKKDGQQSPVCPRGGPATKTHMAAATDRSAPEFSLSGGDHDAPRGIELLDGIIERTPEQKYILIDKAYYSKECCVASRGRCWRRDRHRLGTQRFPSPVLTCPAPEGWVEYFAQVCAAKPMDAAKVVALLRVLRRGP